MRPQCVHCRPSVPRIPPKKGCLVSHPRSRVTAMEIEQDVVMDGDLRGRVWHRTMDKTWTGAVAGPPERKPPLTCGEPETLFKPSKTTLGVA
jgi:hypothetical protein